MSAASLADGPVPELEELPMPESDRVEVERPVPEGELLAGRYSLDVVLAEGGMGVVWLGRHVELDTKVAIKFLKRALSGKEAVVARFLNEARAAAALRSNHVVRVVDVGQLDTGRPYLVMEHLEGIDLDALVERDGPLAVEVAVGYVLEVCEALAEAHAAGIVHRDIKPENLFLSHGGPAKPIVKVVDFGLAKRLDGAAAKVITGPLENMGSPCYMSPEQIESPQEIDERTDIWSLGVVLYCLLTAALPFDGDSVTEVCARVLNAVPLPVTSHRPDLDTQIDGIVRRCLEKKPGDRYATVALLSAALKDYLEAARASVEPGSLTRSSLRLLAPPKRPSDPAADRSAVDAPIRDIPGVRPVRGIVQATLLGFLATLVVVLSAYAAERRGFRPRDLTDGWLTPSPLTVEPGDAPHAPYSPPELSIAGDAVAGAPPTAVDAEESPPPPPPKRASRSKAWKAPHTPKPPEEELSPEEIVRRKMAYEEYLQSNGYQPIRDALSEIRAADAARATSSARGKGSARVPKPDGPRP